MPATMTSRERLVALLRGEPTDRIGVHVMGVRPWTDWWMAGRHPSYGPVIRAVAAKADLPAAIGFETGFFDSAAEIDRTRSVEPVPGHTGVAHRITRVRTPDGALRQVYAVDTANPLPMPVEHFIKTPADLDRFLALPYVPVRPDIEPIVALDRRIGDRGIVMVGLGSDPIGQVHQLLGSERMAIWACEHRDGIHRLLAEMLRRKLDVVEAFAATGLARQLPVCFMHTGAEAAVPPLHGPADFRDFVTRYDTPLHEAIHAIGGFVRVHCHGSVGKVLDDFVAMGVDMLHPVEAPPMGDITLPDAKRRAAGRMTLEGNLQIAHFYEDPPDAFAAVVEQTIAEGAPGGRFCLTPTASPYTVELSDRAATNYLTMIDLACELGR
ncbi:MAG: uroporphyrinogen decarboxylase family protein [Planctomycetota bacterium]